MQIPPLLKIAAALAISVAQTDAQVFAIESTYNPGSTFSLPPDTTHGWTFTIGGAPISVTHLGFFDAELNGLADDHRIGIWDSSGTLVVEGTVPAGTVGTMAGAYAFTTVPPAVLSPSETYFIGGLTPTTSDTVIAFAQPQTYASEITYLAPSYSLTGGFTAPSTTYGTGHGVFGPNFQFTPVPEPHQYGTAISLALLLFFGVRRRHCNRA